VSKNKSKILARAAGGHKVLQPVSGKPLSKIQMEKRINFVIEASGCTSISEVINAFNYILKNFEENPDVVDIVSRRTKFDKKKALAELIFYKNEYGVNGNIKHLLYKEW